MNERYGLGPKGYCICPKCNYKTKHQRGTPCQEMKCPKCGAKMLREGSYHHDLFRKKKEGDD
jgi:peptide subunit release factor 1 (eRF1)